MQIRKSRFMLGLRQWARAIPFLLTGFILMALFVLYPLIRNVWISFTDFNVIQNKANAFVGGQNYLALLTDKSYLSACRNTLLYTLVTVPGQMALGLILACLVNATRRGQSVFKVICYLPVITSWVVVSMVFKYLFMSGKGGMVNYILMELHVIRSPISWLQNTWTATLCCGYSASGKAPGGLWSFIWQHYREFHRKYMKQPHLMVLVRFGVSSPLRCRWFAIQQIIC